MDAMNKMDTMDPHHDGFCKMLYWADRFGDSSIVQTLEYRNEFNVFNFGVGFKKATGISVSQFNEDWRRHMNKNINLNRSDLEIYLKKRFPTLSTNQIKSALDEIFFSIPF